MNNNENLEVSNDLLYYPNFNSKDLGGIKQSLLLYERIHVIAPRSTPYTFSLLSDSNEKLDKIKSYGALGNNLNLYSDESAIKVIFDEEIVRNHQNEFRYALKEDLEDPDVIRWESQWKAMHGGRDYAWLVLNTYFNGSAESLNEIIQDNKYKIEPYPVSEKTGVQLFKVPFLVGMSIGLSGAMWTAVDYGYTLFTDNLTSEEFLMLRLKRGWQRLAKERNIRQSFDIQKIFFNNFATARLGIWTIGIKVPKLIDNITNMSIDEIIDLRKKSDHKDALKKFRSGLAKVIDSYELSAAKNFEDFQRIANRDVDQKIKPAFEILERTNLSIKDIFTSFDIGTTLMEIIKAGPDLLIRTAVPTIAGAGAVYLFGGISLVPVALLALGSGIAANYVENFFRNMEIQSKKRRTARFLTYPLNIKHKLNG